MKRKLTILIFAIALLLAVSAAPVYAGDEDSNPPPPCSVCDNRKQSSSKWGDQRNPVGRLATTLCPG